MKLLKLFSNFEHFEMNWQRQLMQGGGIFFLGLLFATASIFQPEAVVLSARFFSWLPACGIIIFFLGFTECIDAFFSKEQRDFFQNLQVGVLDSVVGGLIVLSVSEEPERLSMMIATFLIVRGIVRIVLVYALSLPQKIFTLVCGFVSITMGILLWQQWPVADGWFISFCLSIEISFRGWAMMMFAFWIKKQQIEDE